ncbi:hypothetical protein COO92_13260 [Thalassospira lohafexi]|uniref:DUF3261 domain-containing protein n=2 Tax=Thalassospira lohafexi TaxID=744227 RepID=A0A2N3L4H6_9PROT|nr:hypothetical protein COO92_13260 [Thalassospira lohafexi]
MRSILILFMTLSLNACVTDLADLSVPNPFASNPAYTVALTPDIAIELPENPWETAQSLEATQQVTAQWRPQNGQPSTATFLARISAQPGQVRIAVLDDLGRRAMTIDWTLDGLNIVKADWVPDALDPERLLGDIVMTYWPDDVVSDVVDQSMTVEETMGQRTIRTNGDGLVFVTIEKPIRDPWQGVATLRNMKLGYTLTIRSQRLGS